MNFLDFLHKVNQQDGSDMRMPFAFDTFREEDTTTLVVQSDALVNEKNEITGFLITTELKNDYKHSQECPCLVETQGYLELPNCKGDELKTHIKDFIISYQGYLIELMILSGSTEELTEFELVNYKNWDRKDLLCQPIELKDQVNYLGLSHWAALELTNHINLWLTAANN